MNQLQCLVSWNPQFLVFTDQAPALLYYSHIPTVVVALFLSVFVFIKSKHSLASKILLFISMIFLLWSFLDLYIWTNGDAPSMALFWSLINLLEMLISLSVLYFSYVLIEQRDVSFKYKAIFSSLLLPVVFLIPTDVNLAGFDLSTCEAIQGKFIYYFYFFELFISLTLLLYAIRKIVSQYGEEQKRVLYVALGSVLFLIAFSGTNIIGSAVAYFSGSDVSGTSWEITQYGLFGMTVFMGFLAYLIVQFKTFNIKLIGAQALVVSLIILVGSQFFFAQNTTAIVLTGVTLALTGAIGILLMRSVKKEVERKEELQIMADKLATANDSLRKLDNAKTEFISIASHQLRTPITAIKGFASLILEGSYGEVSEGVHGALDKIYVSAERLVNLIEDLLNVSRIESGRMTFAFEAASVEKLLKELYDNFILIAKDKKFYLDLKSPKTPLPEVVMDYTKIRELASNFIDNALKYTEKGGVTISAELLDEGVVIDENGFVIDGKKSEFGKVVRITVSDTGIGIPREEIPYLFKKFSRGKDVSRLHVGGTGLGLFVGKAIAEAHHGQVWVESDGAGKGSRFIIEVPVHPVK